MRQGGGHPNRAQICRRQIEPPRERLGNQVGNHTPNDAVFAHPTDATDTPENLLLMKNLTSWSGAVPLYQRFGDLLAVTCHLWASRRGAAFWRLRFERDAQVDARVHP